MKKTVLNIPHSSKFFPEWAKKDVIIPQNQLNNLIDFMVDEKVDKMWEFVPEQNKVVAEFSRLVVDTERFANDDDEPMAIKGMGLYYTHTPFGNQFRIKSDDSYKKCLSIYNDYHKKLEKMVEKCLKQNGECAFLDCHSFHDLMTYTDYDPNTFPDVCIGINGKMSKQAKFIVDAFAFQGYSVKINEPFSGSLVPLKYFNDKRVTSVMIELNRRIYTPSSFKKVQNICKNIFNILNQKPAKC